MTAITA